MPAHLRNRRNNWFQKENWLRKRGPGSSPTTGRRSSPKTQGIHSGLGHDPRQNFALLSPIERKNRTLAQITQRRVHPAGYATVAGGCAAAGAKLRGTLQRCPLEQCHWLHLAEEHA